MFAAGIAAGAADVRPRVVTGKDGMPALILPESLKAAMKRYNSNMQLRQWDEYDPAILEWFRKEHPQSVPWAVWGDYDGNGRTDVALEMRDAIG